MWHGRSILTLWKTLSTCIPVIHSIWAVIHQNWQKNERQDKKSEPKNNQLVLSSDAWYAGETLAPLSVYVTTWKQHIYWYKSVYSMILYFLHILCFWNGSVYFLQVSEVLAMQDYVVIDLTVLQNWYGVFSVVSFLVRCCI